MLGDVGEREAARWAFRQFERVVREIVVVRSEGDQPRAYTDLGRGGTDDNTVAFLKRTWEKGWVV